MKRFNHFSKKMIKASDIIDSLRELRERFCCLLEVNDRKTNNRSLIF
jgi:hypothetical protein